MGILDFDMADIVAWLMRATPYAALLLLVVYLILG